MAANQDAFAVGSTFGISAGNTFTYTASSLGVADMSSVMNNASVSYRGMNSSSADFHTRSKSLVDDKNSIISNDDNGNTLFNYTNTTGSAILNNDKK
jgi:hypothetical protein